MTDLIKQFEVLLSFPRGIVVWINFTSVIPWLDRGMTEVKLIHTTMPSCESGNPVL